MSKACALLENDAKPYREKYFCLIFSIREAKYRRMLAIVHRSMKILRRREKHLATMAALSERQKRVLAANKELVAKIDKLKMEVQAYKRHFGDQRVPDTD